MKTLIVLFTSLILLSCVNANRESVVSPDQAITLLFYVEDGVPYYKINRHGKRILNMSQLGMVFKDSDAFSKNLRIKDVERRVHNQTWTQPWGEEKEIREWYNEMKIFLENQQSGQSLAIVFRLFNDGVGFRYEFDENSGLDSVVIMDELTEFNFFADHPKDFPEPMAWWIPTYGYHRYEFLYTKSPVSDLDTVHTPLTIETTDGLYLSIHEANLTDYASMTLFAKDSSTLSCDLVPWSDGTKVKIRAPFVTPWRTIQIAREPGGLIESHLILNLNEPSKIEDTSWIKPAKYVGIWWGMHIGSMTWESGEKHGATTENAKKYIDFAAENGIDAVLVEGWNIGWDGNWVENGKLFNFTEAYPDYDLEEVVSYAESKGVKIIMHNETSADIGNYEAQMEEAFAYYQSLGIDMIKSGYVGTMVNTADDVKEWHHGQYMVRHYRKVVETAARYGIMLDVHEPIKDTGIRRTWPNMMTREGARGQEFNAWSPDGGNPPEHETIIPFTRGLAGPFDFTPGVFELLFEELKPDNRINTTLAKQLAIYLTYYSPLHMAADLVENYENQPAFQFIKDVPTDWEFTRVLEGKIGDYLIIARKDRNSDDWYLGAVSDEQARSFDVPLDFLEGGRSYSAQIYRDGDDADWKTNPYSIVIEEKEVNSGSVLKINLATSGGTAIRFKAQ